METSPSKLDVEVKELDEDGSDEKEVEEETVLAIGLALISERELWINPAENVIWAKTCRAPTTMFSRLRAQVSVSTQPRNKLSQKIGKLKRI